MKTYGGNGVVDSLFCILDGSEWSASRCGHWDEQLLAGNGSPDMQHTSGHGGSLRMMWLVMRANATAQRCVCVDADSLGERFHAECNGAGQNREIRLNCNWICK
jgi:hypothetical protein